MKVDAEVASILARIDREIEEDRNWHSAMHESGHAIRAISLFGVEWVKKISIVRGDSNKGPDFVSLGYIETGDCKDDIQNARILLSGPLAFHNDPPHKCPYCEGDIKEARMLLGPLYDAVFKENVRFINANRGGIKKIAEALMKMKTLTTEDIERIVAKTIKKTTS